MPIAHDIHLDFETYCDLDLKKVGVHRYVAHKSFDVLTAAWKLDTLPTQSRTVASWGAAALPRDLMLGLQEPEAQGHAFNAAFETAVLDRLGVKVARPLSCTMQRALAYGLPGSLGKACEAAGIAHQKDMAGHRLMLKMSRPLKPGMPRWTIKDYVALAAYCAADVDAEAALSAVIPELSSEERRLSTLDSLMNTWGELGVDTHRVETLKQVAEDAEALDAARCAALTGGAVISPGTQTARLLAWLSSRDVLLPDVARATVEETLAVAREEGLPDDVIEVLQIRLRMARASTRKLAAMLHMADPDDGALRGQFQFVGAGRTGRWSGRGVQVQNMPRVPKGFSPSEFAAMARVAILHGHPENLDVVSPAPVLDGVSWSLRSCLKATGDDDILWSFDFAQIEARVLAWLAGQKDILAVFASGEDVYVWAAAQFGSANRQLGKVLVLALGFGMGASKLKDTAKKAYGVALTDRQAESFKNGWRASNQHIVNFWAEIEFAAKQAVLKRGQTFAAGASGVICLATARTLQMRLPSARVLYYHQPRIEPVTGALIYWGPEVGNRWVQQRTWGGKLAENATQAVARDIMAEAMLRLWRRADMVPCMTVHDELVYTMPPQRAALLETLKGVMLEAPPWAGGLPLAGESKLYRGYGEIEG